MEVNAVLQLRTAYHDMITYRGAERAGGLDASIIFETDRMENIGIGFNNTFLYVFVRPSYELFTDNSKAICNQDTALAFQWLTCSALQPTLPSASVVVPPSTSVLAELMHRKLALSALPIRQNHSTFTE